MPAASFQAPGTSQAREVQGCVLVEVAGGAAEGYGSPWQRHILRGFCSFLRQPVLLAPCKYRLFGWESTVRGGGLTQWVGVVFAYVPMHVHVST